MRSDIVNWGKKTKNKTQHKSCELYFIWGKMRTIAWETASQRALRNCSKEVRGEGSMYAILVKGLRPVKHTFWQKVAAGPEERISPLMILVLFQIRGDGRNWAHKIFS